MKLTVLTAVLFAFIMTFVSAHFLGGAQAPATSLGQEDSTPAAAPPQTQAASPKVLSLEDRADIFMARKDYGGATDYYYRALKKSSLKNPALWNKLGIAYQQQTKYHNAHKAYSNAIHLNKDFAEAWNNIGTIYFMENKFGKSLKYYQRAIELRGSDAAFHLNLGTSYYHLKRYDGAVAEYRTALGLNPNVMAEQSMLGAIVRARGTDVQFYFYMAKAFASIGRAEEAVRYLRRAFEDGFADPKRIDEDPDFKKISQHPAYVELMKNLPVAIKD
jgi:tetratricopeptide (TPR) repeat protein